MLEQIINRQGVFASYTNDQLIKALQGYIDMKVSEGGAGGLTLEDLDTFAELQAIVADATILRQSAIDTFDELQALVADAVLLKQSNLDTFAELQALVADATILKQGDNISALTNNSGFISQLSSDSTPTLGGNLRLSTYGITKSFTTGEVIASRDIVCINTGLTDGKIYKADANVAGLSKGFLGIATGAAGIDANLQVLSFGTIEGMSGLTTGSIYYLSTTPGVITTTPPSSTGDIVRVVGYALSATVLWFSPSPNFIEIT